MGVYSVHCETVSVEDFCMLEIFHNNILPKYRKRKEQQGLETRQETEQEEKQQQIGLKGFGPDDYKDGT